MSITTTSTTTITASTASLTRTTVELGAEAQARIERFVEVRDLINTLDKEKKALDALIKEALGDAEAGTVNGKVRVTKSERTREGVDLKELREVFPEAFDATRTVTEYTVLITK
jgi:predicted phage-related endonuclease